MGETPGKSVCEYHISPVEGAKAHRIGPWKALKPLLRGGTHRPSRTISSILRHISATVGLVDFFQMLGEPGTLHPFLIFSGPRLLPRFLLRPPAAGFASSVSKSAFLFLQNWQGGRHGSDAFCRAPITLVPTPGPGRPPPHTAAPMGHTSLASHLLPPGEPHPVTLTSSSVFRRGAVEGQGCRSPGLCPWVCMAVLTETQSGGTPGEAAPWEVLLCCLQRSGRTKERSHRGTNLILSDPTSSALREAPNLPEQSRMRGVRTGPE